MSAPQQTDGDPARESGAPRAVITDGLPSQLPDTDPEETQEWLDSLDAVVDNAGRERARYVMLRLLERSREQQVGVPGLRSTDYINTIAPTREPWFPGDEHVERRIRAYIRWNAAIMVHRAQRPGIAVGGHISSYASSASLYEVGFNHFFRGKDHPGGGDQIWFQELESFFRGAGWNVIKVIWGREWDPLLSGDRDGALVNLMNVTPDGDYQTYKAEDGAFVREHFFGRDPRTRKLVENMSDQEVWNLSRGGHDYRKVYAAFKAAVEHKGQPTVILAKTIKGWTLGSHFEGRNSTHQMKKLTAEDLKLFRDRLYLPIPDEQLDKTLPPYYKPEPDSDELEYMLERRRQLGGAVPRRRSEAKSLKAPDDKALEVLRRGSGKQEVATTMAFVRLLKELLKDPELGPRFVPIIPDEARTFGLDSLFSSHKIYNPAGQRYTSVDRELMLAYKESEQGVILHEGINEAGSTASFTAVGSSYATHGEPMIPIYIFYSMFGFQRTGDGFWAAADQMTRGFVLGATAGRTTLNGEGLQHEDGHSLLLAHTNPAVVSYDPAFSYEVGHITKDALQRMYGTDPGAPLGGHRSPDVMYYLTVYNEPYSQPAEPENLDLQGLLAGMYRYAPGQGDGPKAQVLAS